MLISIGLIWLQLLIIISPENPILINLEKRLQAIQTLETDFVQIFQSPTLGQEIKERGHLYLRRPDQMRWDYREPERKSFLLQGKTLLVYFYEDKQVIRQSIDEKEIKETILGLLSGKFSLQDLYILEKISEATDGRSITLELKPHQTQEIDRLYLEVDKRQWLIRRIIFFESTGARQEFLFSNLKLNPPLASKIFEIPIPPDWEIIESSAFKKRN